MASDALSLLFKIKADSSDASREIKSLRNIFDSEVRGIEASGTSSFTKLGQSIGLSTTQMSGLAKAAPVAGAAIAAIAGTVAVFGTAAIAAGNAVFNLAKQTADYGSKINDASLKTGLSAETLSGLDLQLKQSGTSMEAFTTAIFMMQKNLEAMADGSKKGAEALQKIGLKPGQLGDTEVVLRQVLKHLAAMPDEAARNAEGARLMGRSYQELSVFLADTGGNIDAAIDKAREMGLVMTGDAASAADEFGDKLDELSNRAYGMGRTIGMQVIPQIMGALDQLNEMAKTSPDIVDYSTKAIQAAIQNWVIVPLHQANAAVIILRNTFGTLGSIVNSQLANVKSIMASQAAAFSGPDIVGGAGGPSRGFGGGGGGGGRRGGGGGRARVEETPESRGLKLAEQLEAQFDKLTPKTELARVALLLLTKEYIGLTDATRNLVFTNAANIDQKKHLEEIARRTAAAERMVTALVEEQVTALNELKGITPTAMDAVDELIKSVEALGGPYVLPANEALLRLRALAIDGAAAVKTLADALAELGSAGLPGGPEGGLFGTPIDPNAPAGDLGPPPEAESGWRSLFETIVGGTGKSQDSLIVFAGMAKNALDGMVQGIGSMIQNWVLLGNTGPGAMKKMVASVLAGLAAQAAMYALFELAKGFAALFFNPAEAAAHFKAAALFGAVAVGAAVGGRALAGNSFQQGAGAGASGGGASGGTSGGTTQGRDTNIIDRERERNQIDVRIHVESNDSHIVNVIGNDFRNNGLVRGLMVQTAEG